MQKLKVHENGQFFMYEDGTPFFYLADTAWDIFQRLTRDEVEYYMSVRSKQGFTAVQSILLSGTETYQDTMLKKLLKPTAPIKFSLAPIPPGIQPRWN